VPRRYRPAVPAPIPRPAAVRRHRRLLIEFGAFRGEAARVTSQAEGSTTEASFARWNQDSITVFWLQRHGQPAPGAVFDPGRGQTSPAPAEQYPLITIYSANGKVIASARIQRMIGQHNDG
jgi:hypothetical protein